MSSGESILARAKSTIDTTGFREQSWTGTFAQYVDVVRREPRVTRTAFERIYDMILEQGVREVRRQPEEDRPLRLLRRRRPRGRRRDLRPRHPADEARQHLQERARSGTAPSAASSSCTALSGRPRARSRAC